MTEGVILLLMAFPVHCTVLAATAAAAVALSAFFVTYHLCDYKRNNSYKYQSYDDSSKIASEPCEHITTPLCLYLYIALEL